MAFTGGLGVDVALECAGGESMPVTLPQATQFARRGGKVVIVGGFDAGKTSIALEWQRIQMSEIQLIPSASFPFREIYPEQEMCLDLLAAGKLNARRLIHCDYPVAGIEAERGAEGGTARFRAMGDGRCECRLQVVPVSVSPLPGFALTVHTPAGSLSPAGRVSELGLLEFDIPGNAEAELEWTYAATAEADGAAGAKDGQGSGRGDHRPRRRPRRQAEPTQRDREEARS
jgi:hypothetical protein